MSKIRFEHKDNKSKGAYLAYVNLDGKENPEPAEMTYSRLSATHIIVDHTEVPAVFKGQGVGQALVENLVAEARREGFKVTPLCPFARAMALRHPEWSDVFV